MIFWRTICRCSGSLCVSVCACACVYFISIVRRGHTQTHFLSEKKIGGAVKTMKTYWDNPPWQLRLVFLFPSFHLSILPSLPPFPTLSFSQSLNPLSILTSAISSKPKWGLETLWPENISSCQFEEKRRRKNWAMQTFLLLSVCGIA